MKLVFSVLTQTDFHHFMFHRQICNCAEQRLSQPLDWSCNYFTFSDFEEEEELFCVSWWIPLCWIMPLFAERVLRQSPKTKDKEKTNSESVWVRGELQKVIKCSRLNVNTTYETLSHLIFIDSYLSILFTSVRPSTWIMAHGKPVLWRHAFYYWFWCGFFFCLEENTWLMIVN